MKKEVKVGIVVLVAIGVFIYGFNFLRGHNIFNPQRKLYAVYPRIDGLQEANPLLLNGYKVGQVSKIELREKEGKYDVLVTFFLTSDVAIPKNSVAKVVSSDFLGSKAVELNLTKETMLLQDGDYLIGDSEEDLKTSVDKRIAPLQKKAEALISSIDSVMQVVTQVLNADVRRNLIASFESIKNTITTLEHTTYKVDTLLSSQQYAIASIIQKVNSITSNIEQNNDKLSNVINNFSNISDSLAKANVKKTIEETNKALADANLLLAQINSGQGTMGKLIKNDSLYNNLNKSAEDLDKLVKDLRINPERYVHISVFGRKDRKKPKT
ncbi:MAG: Mammalian cell entry related domain protein [Bacteroidetes bacterium]|nr:Mammalian cell entry related domain protein [Bacteroidota bacterium]